MTDKRMDEVHARNLAMRKARDRILKQVGGWLMEKGFSKVGVGHFTRTYDGWIGHIGLQKMSGGRNVRVMCHVDYVEQSRLRLLGPWSDKYAGPNSPNGVRYNFGWSAPETEIQLCSEEYCRYIEDVVLKWLASPQPTS